MVAVMAAAGGISMRHLVCGSVPHNVVAARPVRGMGYRDPGPVRCS